VTMRVPQGYTAKSTRFQLSDTAPTIAVKLDKLNIEMETYTVNPGSFEIIKSPLGTDSDSEFKLFIWDENMTPVTTPFER